MLLLPCPRLADLRRMTDSTFHPQFFHQLQKPLHRSRGFDPHQDGGSERGIKLPHFLAFMFEELLDQFACVRVQHRDCLLPRVQIYAYNFHLGLLRSEPCRLGTAQFTRLVVRPTSLCHQLSMKFAYIVHVESMLFSRLRLNPMNYSRLWLPLLFVLGLSGCTGAQII